MAGVATPNVRAARIRRSYGIEPATLDALLAEGLKPCIRCKAVKPLAEFGLDRSRPSGYGPRCLPCCVLHTAEQRRLNPETAKLRKLEGRRRQLKKAGTSLEEFNDRVMTQCGSCACCGEVPLGYHGRGLVPHHCHKTGRFVALVCSACNLGMGKFKDNPSLMRRAAELNEI